MKGGLILKKPLLAIKDSASTLSPVGVRLAVAVCGLALFGLLMLYSASSYSAELRYGDAFYFVKKQAVAAFWAVVSMVAASRLPTEWLRRAHWVLTVLAILLMCLVFVPALGMESYGARRWLNLGFISLQPSEIGKFAYVFFVAAYADKHKPDSFVRMLPPVGMGLVYCVLLLLEPNMSVTMIMVGLMLSMLFVAGAKGKQFLVLLVPLLVAVPVLIALEPYRLQRLLAFVDPWASPKGEGYQLIQSYYALGSGGLFGVGFGNSRQKYLFLPFAESDFIFSVIGEELGLVGALAVLALIVYIAVLGLQIASRADSRFEALLAYGVTAVFGLQSLLNVAVVTGCVPPTGVPLPFVSYGGSSLVCFMAAVGVLLTIDRHRYRPLGVEYGKAGR